MRRNESEYINNLMPSQLPLPVMDPQQLKHLSFLIGNNWTYQEQEDGQVIVSVPLLGDFPDEECAEHTVKHLLANPAQLAALIST